MRPPDGYEADASGVLDLYDREASCASVSDVDVASDVCKIDFDRSAAS